MIFRLQQIADSRQSRDGIINAELANDAIYKIDEQLSQVSLTIFDDDLSRISISAVDPIVVEGQPASFRLQATRQREFGFDVNLISMNKTGNFFSTPGPLTISIPQRSTETTFSLSTQNISGFNPIGEVAVEVKLGNYYNVANSPNHLATVQVIDANLPTGVSIIATNTSIFEGETAEFQVIADHPCSSSNHGIVTAAIS